jgi:thioredoxin reductase (NADPH)
LLLDSEGRVGGLLINARRVDNLPFLERPCSGLELVQRLSLHLGNFGLSVQRNTLRALRPLGEDHFLDLGESQAICNALILATGTRPKPPGFAFSARLLGSQVFSELRPLLVALPAPRRVAVLGSGEAACDYALSLADAGVKVTLLVRGKQVKARGALAAEALGCSLVTPLFGVEVTGLTEGAQLAVSLLNAAGEASQVQVDALLVAIGRSSRAQELLGGGVSFAQDGPLSPAPGVFVVGDARLGALGQVGIAIGDGLAAASAAVGLLEGK